MKKVYKRSIVKLIFSLLAAIVCSLFAHYILTIFLSSFVSLIIIAVLLLLIFYGLLSDNIHFEVENTTFRYFSKNKLIKEYELKKSKISYFIKQSNSTDTINLYINEDTIDCSSLGENKFLNMYYDLEEIVGKEIIKINIEGDEKNE